jgi:hypothetical protein
LTTKITIVVGLVLAVAGAVALKQAKRPGGPADSTASPPPSVGHLLDATEQEAGYGAAAAEACPAPAPQRQSGLPRYLLTGLVALVAWFIVYRSLAAAAAWVTYSLLRLPRGAHLSAAVEFFVYESPKVLRPRLIFTFFGVVALGILLVGYLFNPLM